MRNSALLLTAIEDGDFSDLTVAAAIDALGEDYGHTLARRIKIVSHWIQTAEDAAIISLSLNLGRRHPRVTPLVRELVLAHLRMPPDARPRIRAVPGNHAPKAALPTRVAGIPLHNLNTVEVGVGWILEHLQANSLHLEAPTD
jgi:hypothetical protein